MIDIIIPTMWKSKNFLDYLQIYLNNNFINKIIIIDNDYTKRPNFNFDQEKIKIFKLTSNIYVNPAWNLGVSFSKSKIICLGSDDLLIEDDVFSFVQGLDFEEIDLIGAEIVKERKELQIKKINVNKRVILGDQYFGFGTCMFISREKYIDIPSLYKIWFGDDFLVHNYNNIYTIPILFDKYEMSETINRFENRSVLKSRIDLDIDNAKKFLKCFPKYKLNK